MTRPQTLFALSSAIAAVAVAATADPVRTLRYDIGTGQAELVLLEIGGEGADSDAPPDTGPAEAVVQRESRAATAGAADPLSAPLNAGRLSDDDLDRLAAAAPAFAPGSPRPSESDGTPSNFAEYGIVGDDDRTAVRVTADFPASGIANIAFTDTRGRDELCSGAMIGPDAVLTAAHCVFTNSGWHSGFLVIPGRNAVMQPFGSCGVRQVDLFEDWTLPPSTTPPPAPVDLALLRLDCTVGDEVGILTLRSITDDHLALPSVLQGYPGETIARGRQFRGEGEVVRAAAGGVLHHLIDSTGGMSGAPIWAADDPRIFAVHIGMEPGIGWTPENQIAFFNYATRLTPERLAVIAAWLAD